MSSSLVFSFGTILKRRRFHGKTLPFRPVNLNDMGIVNRNQDRPVPQSFQCFQNSQNTLIRNGEGFHSFPQAPFFFESAPTPILPRD
jgi:hypothetical protein